MERAAHRRLRDTLLAEIADGRYPLGSRLPTEAELCARSGLSRGTVREALRHIEQLGMISRRPGDGTRVIALAPVDDYRPVAGSAEDIVSLVQTTKIVRPRTREVVADRALARRLGTRAGTTWFVVEGPRVRREHPGPPLCWSEIYLRGDSPGREKLRRGDFTAAETAATTIEQTVSAALLDERLADALDAEAASPALVVTRHQRDADGRLISVGIHTHPADRYQLRTIITRSAQ